MCLENIDDTMTSNDKTVTSHVEVLSFNMYGGHGRFSLPPASGTGFFQPQVTNAVSQEGDTPHVPTKLGFPMVSLVKIDQLGTLGIGSALVYLSTSSLHLGKTPGTWLGFPMRNDRSLLYPQILGLNTDPSSEVLHHVSCIFAEEALLVMTCQHNPHPLVNMITSNFITRQLSIY